MHHRILTLSLLLCLGFSLPAQAQTAEVGNAIGTILSVEGTATVTPQGGKPAPATLDEKINLNDVIATGPQSRVFISLADDTRFTLSENTKLTIDKYVYDPDNDTNNHAHYSFLAGAFEYVSGLVAKKNNPDVNIDTPAGSIGIRGTDLWAGDTSEGYGVYVNEGNVSLQNDAGQVQVGAGTGTAAKSRKDAPLAAHKWAEDQIKRIQQSVFLKEHELIAQREQTIREQRQQIISAKRVQVKEQVRQLFQQKLSALKAQTQQVLAQQHAQAKQSIQTALQQAIQQAKQQVQALRQQIAAQKQQVQQAQRGPARQAAVQQLQQMKQQARQTMSGMKDQLMATMKPVIDGQHEAVRQYMQQYLQQQHAQLKQDMEQQIQSMRQDAQQDVRAQMQQMLDQNKQELDSQIEQLKAEAQQQTEQVLQQEQQEQQGEEE